MRNITGYFIGISIIVWIFYDLYVVIFDSKDASISQVLIDYSYQYPIGVFAIGVIMGHLFWRMPDRKKPKE